MTAKTKTRLPTARDTRMRDGLSAYLVEGSSRKAAEATGIPWRTIASWAASEDGKKLLAELKASGGQEIGDECFRIARKILRKIEARIDDGEMPAQQLPICFGILVDKGHRLTGKVDHGADGGWEVTVRSGRRVEETPTGTMIETTAIEVKAGKE